MEVPPEFLPAALPDNFHEDDQLRSLFIRHLLLTQSDELGSSGLGPSNIPKVLVRFWHDSTAIPSDVQQCLSTWDLLKIDGFELKLFDYESAGSYIAEKYGLEEVEAFKRCNHPAMHSDYFRLCYMVADGGFYVDADDVMTEGDWHLLYEDDRLKLQPLCYDLTSGSMVPNEALWSHDTRISDRIFYVNNNPLVAPPDHPILRLALQRATAALLKTHTPRDIQSTTGPGNLTAMLAAHARELALAHMPPDFKLLRSWSRVAETKWNLSYRADERNWRNVDWG